MAFKGWDKIRIQTAQGSVVAVAPVIISASRSTDIPAFYSDWFMRRWREGYVRWTNPFNQKDQYISFAKARVAVFWTKNPRPMLRYVPVLDDLGINYYFTFTVNDYEQEGLEPNVPKLAERIDTFRQLSEALGKARVIWRYDPLLLTKQLTVDRLLEKVAQVGETLHDYTEKLVFSFADVAVYDKVKRNLAAKGFGDAREFSPEEMAAFAQGLAAMNRDWGLTLATCGEEVDLSAYGVIHNKCIDDELMIRLFFHDKALMDFLGYKEPELNLFSGLTPADAGPRLDLKDKGQRRACGCIVSKDIGQYNTCMHLCAYCYANTSEKVVRANCVMRRSYSGEAILGKK